MVAETNEKARALAMIASFTTGVVTRFSMGDAVLRPTAKRPAMTFEKCIFDQISDM